MEKPEIENLLDCGKGKMYLRVQNISVEIRDHHNALQII